MSAVNKKISFIVGCLDSGFYETLWGTSNKQKYLMAKIKAGVMMKEAPNKTWYVFVPEAGRTYDGGRMFILRYDHKTMSDGGVEIISDTKYDTSINVINNAYYSSVNEIYEILKRGKK